MCVCVREREREREREIKCYIGGAWFIVLVMPGVQGLASHLELNIGVCIIIGGISLDALGLFIVISHVCRLNNRAVYSNDLCNSCYSFVIIKLQQPRGHSLSFWGNHVNLCVCWSFLDGSWKISMLLLCKFAYLRIIFIGSLCEIQLKWKSCPFIGLSISLLGLKQFLIWVFYFISYGLFFKKKKKKIVMVSFILWGKSVISAIPAN